MNKRWPRVKLGEVIRQRKEFVTIDDLTIYRRPRVKLHVQGIVLRDEIPGALIKTKRQQVCRSGEFLVAEIDAKVGGFGIVPDALDGAIVSSHYFLFVVNEQVLDRRFLDWYIHTPQFKDQVEAQGSTNYAAIRPSDVLNYEIPLPPLDEQRRIVEKIDQLAAKIVEAHDLRRQSYNELEKLLLSEINRILAAIQPRCPLVPSGAALLVCGQHLSPAEQAEKGIPYITGPADFGPRRAIPTRFATAEKATARQGDVLLTVKGAGVGKVNLAPAVKTAIGRQLFAIRPDHKLLDQVYLWYTLQFCFSDLRDAITATTVPGIGRKDVEHLSIPMPPIEEQRSIVAYLDGLQAEVKVLKQLQAETTAELDALLPSILDKAFKGEL